MRNCPYIAIKRKKNPENPLKNFVGGHVTHLEIFPLVPPKKLAEVQKTRVDLKLWKSASR